MRQSIEAGLVVTSILLGCGDAVLGTLPAGAALSTPLSERNLRWSHDCDPRSVSLRIEGIEGTALAPELHVIGLEATALSGTPPATVRVSRRAPLILALTSPHAFDWIVEKSPDAALSNVFLVSDGGSVEAPPGVQVRHLPATGEQGLGCGTHYPPLTADCNTFALLDSVERVAGAALSSYVGCRLGARFGLIDPQPPRWDALSAPSSVSLSPDALTASAAFSGTATFELRATTALSAGRWYFEVSVVHAPSAPSEQTLGIALAASRGNPALSQGSWIVGYSYAGRVGRTPPFTEELGSGPRVQAGDRLGLAVDLDADRLWISVNDTWLPGHPEASAGIRAGIYAGVLPLYPTIVLGEGAVTALRREPETKLSGFKSLSEAD